MTEFDLSTLDKNAFGGSGKRQSAYLLIYERRKHSIIRDKTATVPNFTDTSLLEKYPNIPDTIVQNLLEENVQIALDRAFLCGVYSKWHLELCRSEKFQNDLGIMQSVRQTICNHHVVQC